MNFELDQINNSLLMKYGRVWDKPLYRLIHNHNLLEKRIVEGSMTYGNIKLCDLKKLIEVPKYPRPEDREKYILEILVEIPPSLKEELHGEDGFHTYEPLMIFKKKVNGIMMGIDPSWPMVNILAFFSFGLMKGDYRETFSPEYEMHKMDKNDYDKCLEILDNELPDMAMKIKKGSASFWDSSKQAYLIN